MYYWESKVKTIQDLNALGYEVMNDIVTRTTIAVTAHFGNSVSFVINTSDNKQVISLYNNTRNIGSLLRTWVEFYEWSAEDGVTIEQLKNFPVRLVYDPTTLTYVGFGHFMKDKFMLYSDFITLDYFKSENQENTEKVQTTEKAQFEEDDTIAVSESKKKNKTSKKDS